MNLQAAAGNVRMGLYSDSANMASALYGQTASTPAATGFPFIPLTAEILLTQTVAWIAFETDNGTANIYLNADSGTYKESFWASQAYNPFGTPWTNSGRENNMENLKIGHS